MRRHQRVLVTASLCAGAVWLAVACSKTPPNVGGLMLVVREDTPLGLDRLVIEVSARGTVLRRSDLRVPEDGALPTTLAIASNGDASATVSLSVSGYKGGAAVDRRDHLVEQVPTDRVATVDVVLSARCTSKVTLAGSEARSTCGAGETCNPTSGACASATLNGSALPTFEAGDEGRPPKVEGGAVSSDASVPNDAADGGGSGEGGGDGSVAADASKGGLVTCTGATEKRCDNKCVSTFDPEYGCASPTCQRCALDSSTVYSCQAGKCALAACAPGYKLCGSACVNINEPNWGCSPTSCQTSGACPTPGAGQTVLCDNGVCKIGACGPGTKKCGSECRPTLRANGCEDVTCSACAADLSCQGTPSKCACTPDPITACKDQECGPAVDNCGNAIVCPDTCGPAAPCGGTKCGCVLDPPAVTCAGKDCGTVVGNCNQVVTCTNKACTPGLEACGSVTPNKCDLPPSCTPGGAGRTDCRGESCCVALVVTDATFNRANNNATPASVSAVRIDKYKVTVARFRSFVDAWNGGWRPKTGDGRHTHLHGGKGLAAPAGVQPPYEGGWFTGWASLLATTGNGWASNLGGAFGTWTAQASPNDKHPITNVQWAEAYAFCIWDGGFLPSFAELSNAWTGGSAQRLQPWGAPDATANEADFCPSVSPDGGPGPICTAPLPVGSKSAGDGLFGHADLVGGAYEWTLDAYAGGTPDLPTPCTDCSQPVYVSSAITSQRGAILGASSYTSSPATTKAAGYQAQYLTNRVVANFGHPLAGPMGFRCARRP